MINVCEAILNTPHALIAGATGSGKSVLLNSVICEGLNRDVEFWFIDLKRVELNQYKKTYNCLKYVTEPKDVIPFLDDIIDDMDAEYERMESRGEKETTRPHRYLVIDELADLVNTKGVLEKLVKLGRLGRAAHIHMIGATQDPSKYTLSAQFMQNITCSVALKCKDAIASRQIVGVAGAEVLPAHGKGLMTTNNGVVKVDIPLTDPSVISRLINQHTRSYNFSEPRKTVRTEAPRPVYTEAPRRSQPSFVDPVPSVSNMRLIVVIAIMAFMLLVFTMLHPEVMGALLMFVVGYSAFWAFIIKTYKKRKR